MIIPSPKIVALDDEFDKFVKWVNRELKAKIWRSSNDFYLFFEIPECFYTKQWLRKPIFIKSFSNYCERLTEKGWAVHYDKNFYGGYNLMIRPNGL